MVRRSLFLGLTAMLAAVLVYLVVQGRKKEKTQQQNPRPIEVVRESKSTLTRIIAPEDLEIMESKMELVQAEKIPTAQASLSAKHRIVIRNNGPAIYTNLRLRISYITRGERVIDRRTMVLEEELLPGQARTFGEFAIENVPGGTAKSTVTILSAEMAAAGTPK